MQKIRGNECSVQHSCNYRKLQFSSMSPFDPQNVHSNMLIWSANQSEIGSTVQQGRNRWWPFSGKRKRDIEISIHPRNCYKPIQKSQFSFQRLSIILKQILNSIKRTRKINKKPIKFVSSQVCRLSLKKKCRDECDTNISWHNRIYRTEISLCVYDMKRRMIFSEW